MDAITSFRGKYAFLANSYSCMVTLDGMNYPSVEHAYQAAKTFDIRGRQGMQVMRSAHDAYYFGKKVTLRDDWKHVKGQIMLDLLRQKFHIPELAKALLQTEDMILMPRNENGDLFWSRTYHKRQNKLGGMLTHIRAELQKELG